MMQIRPAAIDGVVIVERSPLTDSRGSFSRLFCAQELKEIVGSRSIVQINLSETKAVGAIRGLHYQRYPHAEMKMVSCLKGRVWDVAVDLRAGSQTFLKWHAEELSPENSRMLVIPEGCAHGFQVLEPNTQLLYLHTAFYSAAAEGGVQPTDPKLRVLWPLSISEVSDRDQTHPLLTDEFVGLTP